MSIPASALPEILARLDRNAGRTARVPSSSPDAAEKEIEEIHYPILAWCKNQVPFVPCVHARTDQVSTIAEGVPDFIVAYRGKVFWIECKTRTGKLSPKQLGWQMALEAQGASYHLIRSFQDFLDIINGKET